MTDHETTLRKIADDIAENLATYPKGASQVPVLVREMKNLACERDACLAGAEALRRETCVWAENENGAWDTACGRTWEFTNDGPVENRMNYCMDCGKRVAVTTAAPR